MKKLFKPLVLLLALAMALLAVGCGGEDEKKATYTVTVVGGTLADGATTATVEEGTSLTVTAAVPDGKVFVNWTSGQTIKSTDAVYTFTVNIDITLTANFEDEAEEGKNTFVLEAEAMNLDDFAGVGYSGGGAGKGAIQGASDSAMPEAAIASLNKKDSQGNAYNNGYFVGFFNGDGTHFKFTFESDADVTDATLTLRLGSEHGDMLFNPDLLTIKVNGEELDYQPFTVTGSGEKDSYGAFKDYKLSAKISLKKNELIGNNDLKDSEGNVVIERPLRVQNVVELILRANDYWTTGTNPTGGPGIDCIKIATSSTLTWTDYWLGGWPEDFEEFNGEITLIEREGYVVYKEGAAE